MAYFTEAETSMAVTVGVAVGEALPAEEERGFGGVIMAGGLWIEESWIQLLLIQLLVDVSFPQQS